jgi:hypothetical protein
VQQRVPADPGGEGGQFVLAGQLAVDEQVGHLGEVGVFGQVLDRVTAVAQDAGIPVDVGDRGGTGRGVRKAWVEGDQVGLAEQLADVGARCALGGGQHGQLQ